MKYMHKGTGNIDSRDGWISSYAVEELEDRGLTAAQAFEADVGQTLFALVDENPAAALGRKGGLSTSKAKRDAAAENGKKGGRPKKDSD